MMDGARIHEERRTNGSQRSQAAQQPALAPGAEVAGSLPAAASFARAVRSPQALTPADVLALQRTVGNAAVNQLLRQVTTVATGGAHGALAATAPAAPAPLHPVNVALQREGDDDEAPWRPRVLPRVLPPGQRPPPAWQGRVKPALSSLSEDKYRNLKSLHDNFIESEKNAPERRVNGEYIGQEAAWRPLWGAAIKYLKPEEKDRYELKQKDDNLFYWTKDDKVFDTTEMQPILSRSGQKGRAIFIMTADGKIYAADEGAETKAGSGYDPVQNKLTTPKRQRWRINHSSFLRGERVAAAGELIFKDGALVGITDMSGHYHPELQHTLQALREFKERGVDLAKVKVTLASKGWGVDNAKITVWAEDLVRCGSDDETVVRRKLAGREIEE